MRNGWRIAGLAMMMMVLASCTGPSASDAGDGAAIDDTRSFEVIRRKPMRPYAEAATVKLFTRTFEPQPFRTDKQGFSEGRALTPAERAAIESKISLATWNGAPVMVGCCLPHHFLRYYDKAGRQVGEIAICFCCACIYGRPEPPGVAGNTALDFDPEALKAVMKDMGVRTDFGCEPAAAGSPGA